MKVRFWLKVELYALVFVSIAVASVGAMEASRVNPYKGMQTREEVYEFTADPAVKKEGDKWVITFASKGKCDVTVSILDRAGKVVRHLASGVLGSNAPHPLQQNSLSQKLEWDGRNDQGKPAPAGCRVTVGLGLRVMRVKSNFNPYGVRDTKVTYATDPDGNFYLRNGLKYGKDGKYLGRYYPPPSRNLQTAIKSKQMQPLSSRKGNSLRVATTEWGDKVAILSWYGWGLRIARGKDGWSGDIFKTLGPTEYGKLKVVKDVALPAPIAAAKQAATRPVKANPPSRAFPRMAVNRSTDQLYVLGRKLKRGARSSLYRLDGKTLEWDKTWLADGEFNDVSEVSVGPNGNIYARIGSSGYGQWIVCVDPEGRVVNFGGDAVDLPIKNKWPDGKGIYMGFYPTKMFHGAKVLWTGLKKHSNVHERGLYISPMGLIVAQMQSVDVAYAVKHGIKVFKKGRFEVGKGVVSIWSPEGKLLTANAIGPTFNGHGVAMDRDGNIYSARDGKGEPGNRRFDGLPGIKANMFTFGGWGTIAKFRAAGQAKYEPRRVWAYSVCSQSTYCTCIQQVRWDLDYWKRTWYPACQLGSIMVLDANGNRMARIGKYGTREEEKGHDLRFIWPRAVCVSDTAAYLLDRGGRSRLAISYVAEETISLDAGSALGAR
jgi:hypothetical protein